MTALEQAWVGTPVREVAAAGLHGSRLPMPAEPLDPETWFWLTETVRREKLHGLLALAVRQGVLPVTDEQRADAGTLHAAAMGQALLLDRSLLAALDLLGEAGCEARVLKGVAVATLDYADPSLRCYGDVDLLVRGDQVDRAVTALSAAGYQRRFAEPRPGFDRRFGKGVSFDTPAGHELDVHRTFVQGPLGLAVTLEDLWGSADEVDVLGRPVPALSPEHRLLHAAYHVVAGNDGVLRLAPLRDVAEMVLYGRNDQDLLIRTAERWKARAVLAEAVRTTWEVFDIADVTSLWTWATRVEPTPAETRMLAVYRDGHDSYAAKSLASLRELPTWRERAGLLTSLVLPSRRFLADRGLRRGEVVTRRLPSRGRR